jgi:hypothetical protein
MSNEDVAPDGAEPSATDQVERLANAFRRYREAPPMPSDATASLGWHDLTRWSFAEAQIELTDEQFHRAWRCLWQSMFMGGNYYTQDAKRVLAAAFGKGDEA